MADWFERIARLASLSERVSTLTDGVKSLVSIHRPDGTTLRIAPPET